MLKIPFDIVYADSIYTLHIHELVTPWTFEKEIHLLEALVHLTGAMWVMNQTSTQCTPEKSDWLLQHSIARRAVGREVKLLCSYAQTQVYVDSIQIYSSPMDIRRLDGEEATKQWLNIIKAVCSPANLDYALGLFSVDENNIKTSLT